MAIQAQLYADNFGLGASPDFYIVENTPNNSNNFFIPCDSNEFKFNLQHQQNNNFLIPCDSNGFKFNLEHQQLLPERQSRRNHMPGNMSQSIYSQIQQHSQEFDSYVSLQNERLKLALQEQRNQQMKEILKKAENRASFLLTQKNHEISNARKRRLQLEESTRKMEIENQKWQKIAMEKESMAVSLSNKLEKLKETECCTASSSNGCEETGEMKNRGMMCRSCSCRNACVLFLPCSHICFCNVCETFHDFCPLCSSPKKATIQALFS